MIPQIFAMVFTMVKSDQGATAKPIRQQKQRASVDIPPSYMDRTHVWIPITWGYNPLQVAKT